MTQAPRNPARSQSTASQGVTSILTGAGAQSKGSHQAAEYLRDVAL